MYIKNKWASLVWKTFIVAAGVAGLLIGSGITSGAYDPHFINMFTNLSNALLVLYFIAALAVQARASHTVTFAPTLKRMVVMADTMTFLIAHFMLGDTLMAGGYLHWELVLLHYVVPIMSILDLLLFDRKGTMRAWGPFVWVLIPLGYLAGVEVLVNVFGIPVTGGTSSGAGNYPYPFLNAQELGWPNVIQFIAVVLAVFVVLGFIWLAIDKALAVLSRRDSSH